MANQVGVVDTGQIQLTVSSIDDFYIGLSVVMTSDAFFHFRLLLPETHILADRLLDIASQLSSSPFLPGPMIERPAMQVRASVLDHHRIGLSVQVPEYDGVSVDVRFAVTPPEANRLADLFLTALVSGGHMSPEGARAVKREAG